MSYRKQSGQSLITAAIAMVVLAGFAGLGVDMGALRYQKRLQQTAADAAAIAGAQDLNFGSGMNSGAQNAATLNGFTDGGTGAVSACDPSQNTPAIGTICVQVLNPPADVSFNGGTIPGGAHTTSATCPTGDTCPPPSKYVEAIVAEVQPTYFMKIFGVNSAPVYARAVATNVTGGTNQNCLVTLGLPTSSIIGIDPTGHADINGPSCGISDNGNMDTTGNNYTVEASNISVAGQCLGSHCDTPSRIQCTASSGGVCGGLNGAPAVSNPLCPSTTNCIQPPSMPAYSTSCPATPPAGTCDYSSASNSTATIQPGTYNSINIGSNSTITMAPGIYYINGPITIGSGKSAQTSGSGLNFSGKGSLSDTANPGVMLYFTNGSTIGAVGGGNVPDIQLSPMTTAENSTYAGILIYMDPSCAACKPAGTVTLSLGGDNNSTYNGVIYAPATTLNFYGNNTTTFDGEVIGYSMQVTGSPVVNLGVAPAGVPIPAYLTQPVLVE